MCKDKATQTSVQQRVPTSNKSSKPRVTERHQTRVTGTRAHLATGFAVNRNPRKKGMVERKGGGVQWVEGVWTKRFDCRTLVTGYLADRIKAVRGNLGWGTYHENHHESKKEREQNSLDNGWSQVRLLRRHDYQGRASNQGRAWKLTKIHTHVLWSKNIKVGE